MREIILLKQGEMVLKGLNRRGFEDKLMGNAKRQGQGRHCGLRQGVPGGQAACRPLL